MKKIAADRNYRMIKEADYIDTLVKKAEGNTIGWLTQQSKMHLDLLMLNIPDDGRAGQVTEIYNKIKGYLLEIERLSA